MIELVIVSRLLEYPDAALWQHQQELFDALASSENLDKEDAQTLGVFLRDLIAQDVLDVQASYSELFDRGRATSLLLFEHVHGESRDRGQAMIDLIKTYEQAGLFLAPGELPDYLPVMLEFASTQTPQIARAFLGEMAHLLNAIFNALQQRKSPYASVLGALLELAGEQARAVKVEPDEAIDAAWEEPPVFDGCSSKGQGRSGQAQPITFVRNEASGLRASGAAHNGVSP